MSHFQEEYDNFAVYKLAVLMLEPRAQFTLVPLRNLEPPIGIDPQQMAVHKQQLYSMYHFELEN